jgi:aminoglycoside phosphotransferase (APT) family kinase protein
MKEMGLRSDVRIPEVYHFFERDRQTYIVMEYIEGETVKQRLRNSTDDRSLVYSKVAAALDQLLSITPPPNLPNLGPIGGGPIYHFFFADNVSDIEYDSVDKLQQQVNSVMIQ